MSELPLRPRRRWIAAVTIAAALAIVAHVWLQRKRSPPNLLLITIDTLRADRVGAYGDTRGTTPVLDGLARRGCRFENVQTPVPLTGPAHATILTGLEPPVHGLRDNELLALDPRHATLASILKSHEYQTAAFVGGYPVTSRFGFGSGFETFHEGFPNGGTERTADHVADNAIAWISTAREPFFAWVHFFDPHDPYSPPQPFRERFPPYEGEIAFTDAQIARLLTALDVRRPTLVAALADHGEGLGEHDEATHGILVYESTLRVPWILAGAGVPSGRVVRERAGTLDVFPTLLSLLRIPAPKGLVGIDRRPALEGLQMGPAPLYGESLLGRLACRWAALRTWTEGDWKLIAGTELELYDLASDPGETQNRASSEKDRVTRMRRALASAIERMAPGGDRLKEASLSPEQEERLRSLGYLSGSAGSTTIDEPGQPDPRTRVQDYALLQELIAHADDPGALRQAASLAGRDKRNPAAQFTLGLLAQRQRDLPLAARAMGQAVELDSRPTVRDAYGRLLREMGRLPESERQLRLALETPGPYTTRLRANLAETLLASGRSEEARKLVTEALQVDPSNAQALELRRRLVLERLNQ